MNNSKLEIICNIANDIKTKFEKLSPDSFYVFFKSAQELQYLENIEKSENYEKFIKPFEYFFSIKEPENLKKIEKKINISETSISRLCKLTQQYIDSNYTVVCDDFFAWKLMQERNIQNNDYHAFKAIYRLFENKSANIIFDFLSNKKLFNNNQEHKQNELIARINEIKNAKHLLPKEILEITEKEKNSFLNFFKMIIEIFPNNIKEDLEKFNCLIPFIEHDKNTNLADAFINIAHANSKILWGMENILKFKPEEIILFLTQEKTPAPSCTLFLKNAQKILNIKINDWKKNKELNSCVLNTKNNSNTKYKIENPHPRYTPNIDQKPNKISATGLTNLMQDPYGFYAKYILELKFLNRLWQKDSAKEFGILTHSAIEELIKHKRKIEEIINKLETNIFWKKRIERILYWIKNQIEELKPQEIYTEKEIVHLIEIDGKKITMSSRIDLLMILQQNLGVAINFKTGTLPTKKEVISGYFPQIALETYLARLEEKKDIQAEFWQLKGTLIAGTISNIALQNEFLEKNITKIIKHYLVEKNEFIACPWPLKQNKYNRYKHFERIEE